MLLWISASCTTTSLRPSRQPSSVTSVDCRFGGRRDLGMAVQSEIVIGSEIDEAPAVDRGFGAGNAVMHAKKRIGNPERAGGVANEANFFCPLEFRRPEARRRWRRSPEAVGRGSLFASRGREGFEQARLRLLRQAEQIALGGHRVIPP